MKKSLSVFAACILILLCLMGLAACKPTESGGGSGGGETHTHDFVRHAAVQVTCGQDGNIEYFSCTGCNKLFSDDKGAEISDKTSVVIPATGNHTLSEWNKDESAHWRDCSVCGQKVDAAKHTWDDEVCSVCGYTHIKRGLIYTLSDGEYTVTGLGETDETDISIPAEYNGLPVTGIGEEAFYKRSALTSITIPDSVTTIGVQAFYGCSSLTGITIPDSVTTIDTWAFAYCSNLKTAEIGSGATSIDDSAFSYCNSLESITVKENNTAYTCQDGILYNKAKTKFIHVPKGIKGEVIIPQSITEIDSYRFSGCGGLTSAVISDGVTTIGEKAFSGCSGLTRIVIPDSMETMENYAFEGCPIEDATLPTQALDRVPKDKLTTVVITSGERITGGPGGWFRYRNVKRVVLPDSVTTIDKEAFYQCGIESIVLGSGVKTIGEMAFYGCNALSRVDYKGDLNDWCNIEFSSSYANPVYSAHNLLINGVNVTEGKLVIPETVTKINPYAFIGFSGLTSIVIPDTVTSVGKEAFYGCPIEEATLPAQAKLSISSQKSLKKVVITSGDKIVDAAFKNCSNLNSVSIPNSVTTIGSSAFYGCSALKSIVIPDSVTTVAPSSFSGCSISEAELPAHAIISIATEKFLKKVIITSGDKIDDSAFKNCANLNSVSIPSSVTTIGSSAFFGCTGLTSVVLPSSVTRIGSSAFYGCTGLTSIIIPSKVTMIDIGTFKGCANLTSVAIPDSVTIIDNEAFYGCNTLINLDIPDSVATIGKNTFALTKWYEEQPYGVVVYAGKVAYKYKNTGSMPTYLRITLKEGTLGIAPYAFYNCNTMISISIPDSVSSIGEDAFFGCDRLSEIKIPSGMKTIGTGAFGGSGLGSVVIPDGVTTIGNSAFAGCRKLTSVVIPESVTTFEYGAFDACFALNRVEYKGDIDSWCKIEFGSAGANPLNAGRNLYIDGKSVTDLVIPNTVTEIKDCAFMNCNLTSVVIPVGVTSIGGGAFSGCTEIKSITIPNSVKSIGGSAFYNCSSLGSIVFMGTKEQWEAIPKGYDWNTYSGNYTITYKPAQ